VPDVSRCLAPQDQEEFAAARVASGAELDGLYPLGERWREAYETCVKEHEP